MSEIFAAGRLEPVLTNGERGALVGLLDRNAEPGAGLLQPHETDAVLAAICATEWKVRVLPARPPAPRVLSEEIPSAVEQAVDECGALLGLAYTIPALLTEIERRRLDVNLDIGAIISSAREQISVLELVEKIRRLDARFQDVESADREASGTATEGGDHDV